MNMDRPPLYYLFEDAEKGSAVGVHLDLEVLKQCAINQGYSAWVIRDADFSPAAKVVAQA
jgi:hypothetical protein